MQAEDDVDVDYPNFGGVAIARMIERSGQSSKKKTEQREETRADGVA